MRNRILITVSQSDRRRLRALVEDRNAPQKHVWRAEIVLFTADELGQRDHAPRRQVEDGDPIAARAPYLSLQRPVWPPERLGIGSVLWHRRLLLLRRQHPLKRPYSSGVQPAEVPPKQLLARRRCWVS